jgi:solute carrier family 25 protein 33/36
MFTCYYMVVLLYFIIFFRKDNTLTCRQCVKNIYKNEGPRSFYRGMTASYFGVTETVIHFVIYESLKARLLEYNGSGLNHDRQASDFLRFMFAGAISKTCATCVAYPHGEISF